MQGTRSPQALALNGKVCRNVHADLKREKKIALLRYNFHTIKFPHFK